LVFMLSSDVKMRLMPLVRFPIPFIRPVANEASSVRSGSMLARDALNCKSHAATAVCHSLLNCLALSIVD
jgi:hypothetical protein